jgi:kynureninase
VLALQELFLGVIARGALPPLRDAQLVTPVASGMARGHFLTFETASAQSMYETLMRAKIVTDVRGHRIRFGFGCYHSVDDIVAAIAAIARALA